MTKRHAPELGKKEQLSKENVQNIWCIGQILLILSSRNKILLKREIDAIMECAEELNCNNLLIITWDQENVVQRGDYDIQILPYYKWCLNK